MRQASLKPYPFRDQPEVFVESLEATHEVGENGLFRSIIANGNVLRAEVMVGHFVRDPTDSFGKLLERHISP